MIANSDSLILEFSSTLALSQYWPLCTELVSVTPTKAVIYTSRDADAWTRAMDHVMQMDTEETSVKLRWKSSKYGGKVVAVPSATSRGLAASRRRGTAPISKHDFVAEVMVRGEIGQED
eukprot:5445882-Pyramimonas_sp.AAC.1